MIYWFIGDNDDNDDDESMKSMFARSYCSRQSFRSLVGIVAVGKTAKAVGLSIYRRAAEEAVIASVTYGVDAYDNSFAV